MAPPQIQALATAGPDPDQEHQDLHGGECDTDHALICTKVNLTPRKLHHTKSMGRPCINASHASDPLKTRELLGAIRASLDKGCGNTTNADSKWKQVCSHSIRWDWRCWEGRRRET